MNSHYEITVGPRKADIVGKDNRAIQMALDAAAYRGGGTVRVLPGEYTCFGPIRLRSNVRLQGDRAKTVLKMAPIVRSKLALDADTGQKEITPVDASEFQADMGVVVCDKDGRSPMATMPLTISRVADGVLHTTDYNVHDMNAERGDCVVSYFPLIHGCEIEHASVDGFTLDARPDRMDGLEAHWGGAIYLRYARHCLIRNVTARGCVGDGIRFGRTEHVTVEDCEAVDNYHYGIHPGSHSPWAAVRRCHIHGNGSDGLYLCWGVREGVFEDNVI
ncbi:MAG: right-handed parallel beta-helix repeat-containing protein, partial [Planctomycetes bacterium]|nr:right-handed parallel beta-helix repeat-containing protein [Planctomycetota bacterium]